MILILSLSELDVNRMIIQIQSTRIAQKMSTKLQALKQKIGQKMIIGFMGTEVSDALKKISQEWAIGGYILFRRNLVDLKQSYDLIDDLKAINRSRSQDHLGPLIAVDEEGGKVCRVPLPFSRMPAMANVGLVYEQTQDFRIAHQVGQVLGTELKALGFNLNFAPVVDVNSNPLNPIIASRAFSDQSEIVGLLAEQLILGMQQEGVMPCVKHFPGHGDTLEDSHLGMATCHHSIEALERIELLPYQHLFQNHRVDLLMSAHVKYPAVDPNFPATLSKKWIKEILRGEMGYSGVVVSDDLEMQGIEALFDRNQVAELGLEADLDIFLVCQHLDKQVEILEAILRQIEMGKYSMDQLDQSLARINRLKQKYRINHQTSYTWAEVQAIVGNEKHQAVVAQLKI
jgi:beta-N-acetylhexosaminidase